MSTHEQDTDMQERLLRAAGCTVVHRESASSVRSRPVLAQALHGLKKGDTLVVFKLDRLARSLKQLLHILEQLELRGAGFRSLTEPVDTTSAAGRMMLQILGSVAEFERSLIVERTRAGQSAAKARGAVFGRPRALSAAEEATAVRRYEAGEGTLSQIAREYNCHLSSIKRAVLRKRAINMPSEFHVKRCEGATVAKMQPMLPEI